MASEQISQHLEELLSEARRAQKRALAEYREACAREERVLAMMGELERLERPRYDAASVEQGMTVMAMEKDRRG